MSAITHYFYVVPGIGTGVYPNGFRPNISAGTPYAGQQLPDGRWVIRTPATSIPGQKRYTEAEAQAFCAANGPDYDSIVASWYAG